MMNVRRWLPLSGVVFVVLVLVAVIGLGGDTPSNDASGTEVAKFYNDQDVRQALAAFIWALSVPFVVLFATSVASAVRSTSGRDVWEHVFIGGSVLTGAILGVLSAIHFSLSDGATNDVAPGALQALNVVEANSWVAYNAALGLMMLGAAGCLLLSAPRWLGWAALVLGLVLFIPYADFFALVLTLIWIIVTSIVVFRRASTAAPARETVTAA